VTAARLAFALCSALIAGACQPSPKSAASPDPDTAVASPRPGAPASEPRADLPTEQRTPDLFGSWTIETVAAPGVDLRERYWDMTLFVGNRQLEILSQCVTIGPFDYARTVGGGIVVTPAQPRARPPAAPGVPVLAQCARGHTPQEQALPRILLAARDVTHDGRGTVTLTGKAGSIVMRRPAGALANPRGRTPPPATPPLLGAWRLFSLGGRQIGDRIELLLRPRTVEWRSGCVNEARTLHIDRDSLVPGEVDPFPVCERGRSEAEEALERLLSARVAARTSANGRLTLSGSGVAAEFVPLT
jgi:hypothetical protein